MPSSRMRLFLVYISFMGIFFRVAMTASLLSVPAA